LPRATSDNRRIAIEIETGNSNAIANIKKALAAGFDQVISIATTNTAKDKILRSMAVSSIEKGKTLVLTGHELLQRPSPDEEPASSFTIPSA